MIQREDVVKIGKFNKTHGTKGEISFSFTCECFDQVEDPFLICELDGILVPFRLETCRFISNAAALVKVKTIDSDLKACQLAHKDVYFPKNQITKKEENAYAEDDFVGFALIDETAGEIGLVVAVDHSTLNILFIVEQDAAEIYIPAADEMITRVDAEEKKIYMKLPAGLLAI